MADDEDYDGGEMDGEDFGDDEPMDDIELEQPDDEVERVQLIEVSILNFF